MATSAKRRAMYQRAGTWSSADASFAQPSAPVAAATFAGGRTHAVSGKTQAAEASAVAWDSYIQYGVIAVAVIGGALLLIHAWRS